ncbi:hypothetical protein [Zhihengliuella halotolerans]|nr:hypothetical protein [Zhihengliuella halotolerans]
MPVDIQISSEDYGSSEQVKDFEAGLEYIMSIPDDVLLRGDVATAEWAKGHLRTNVEGVPSAATGGEAAPVGIMYASVLGCSAAIGTVIATTAIPVAKLLKIKRLVKAVGGVKETVKLMWGASFSYEKISALGGSIGVLAAEFIGVTSIREKCFN